MSLTFFGPVPELEAQHRLSKLRAARQPVGQPDVLGFLRDEGIARMKADLAERDAATLPPDAPSTEQWFNRTYPCAIGAMTLTSWLPRMILHDNVTAAFGDMRWWIFASSEPPVFRQCPMNPSSFSSETAALTDTNTRSLLSSEPTLSL